MNKTIRNRDIEEALDIKAPDAQNLMNISQLITKAVNLLNTMNFLEESIAEIKKEYDDLVMKKLVDAFSAAGTLKFTTSENVFVEIKDYMAGSLPKEESKRRKALRWIETHGGRDLIKTNIEVSLGRGEKALAEKVMASLVKMNVTFGKSETVWHSTLWAFAKELIKNGKKVPLEALGLYAGRIAKIKLPREESNDQSN